ncbi:MAG: hypothetical protein Q7K57_41730 [Burkholderiaceae bacterium]|nr:hypothetical protein [Burkholderiaceae bacterium]
MNTDAPGLMEDLLSWDIRTGEPTGMDAALAETINVLDGLRVRYVLIGTLALNMYVRPRFTSEIRILCSANNLPEIRASLSRDDYGNGRAAIDVKAAISQAQRFTLMHSMPSAIFATGVLVAAPLALLWLYLVGDGLQDDVDAAQLVMLGCIEQTSITALLAASGSRTAIAAWNRVNAEIQQRRHSG